MEIQRIPPTPALRRWSEAHGFSPELVARWGEFYGDLPAMVSAMRKEPPSFLRMNPLRGDPAETRRRLEEKGVRLQESGIPLTWQIVEAPFSVGATEEYLTGRYFLQDVSSALAPLALEPRPREKIADLCAAPGGKTIGIAGLTHDDAAIFAFDANPDRVQALESNLHRCGVTSAAVYSASAQEAADLGIQFDRILLDAPCTGEGVIAKDAGRRQGQLQEYASCAVQQHELLGVASKMLRPGGVLVYSTCTLAPEENEAQVDAAIKEFGFRVETLPVALRELKIQGHPLAPGLLRAGPAAFDPSLKLTAHALPHPHGCMGFYIARLRKEAA